MDWRRRTKKDLRNTKELASTEYPFSFSFYGLGGDRRIQDVEADRPFPYWTRKKDESYIFLFLFPRERFMETDWTGFGSIDGDDG
jgi:hypothetical protein